jgi:hypothetical protein
MKKTKTHFERVPLAEVEKLCEDLRKDKKPARGKNGAGELTEKNGKPKESRK